jgi:hypothetical protein
MHRIAIAGFIALAIALLVVIAAGRRLTAAPQLAVPNGDKLRFRLVGDEPIAGPDGQSVVAGWKVLVFQDMKTARCYATFVHGAGESVAGEIACAAPAAR